MDVVTIAGKILPPKIDLRKILDITDNVILFGGLVLNFTLLYLILRKTNQRLNEYKPILLQNCLIDIFYNTINAVTKPITDFKYGTFFASLTGAFSQISDPWNNILFAIWAFAILYCVTSIPVQFLYRYFLIVKSYQLSKLQYAFMLFMSFCFAFIYGLINCYTFWPNPTLWNERANLLKADSFYYEGVPSFVFADIDNPPLKVLFSYCYFLVFCSYLVVIIANYKVYKYLKNIRSTMSTSSEDVQTQINSTFIIQACIPVLTSFVPIVTALTMTFLKANIPGLGICVSLIWSWIPIANPMLTLIFIKQYRKRILNFFRKNASFVSTGISMATNNGNYSIRPASRAKTVATTNVT